MAFCVIKKNTTFKQYCLLDAKKKVFIAGLKNIFLKS